jgi:predicted membrane-bound spermidine synthase
MVRTITASGALLNTLVVAYGLAIVELTIRRRAFALGLARIAAAVCLCWAIRHSLTVSKESALLLSVLSGGLIVSAAWAWLQNEQTMGAIPVSYGGKLVTA